MKFTPPDHRRSAAVLGNALIVSDLRQNELS